ncbi:MAG: hypothetical protein ABEI98_00935 [Halorhabdus sp.]
MFGHALAIEALGFEIGLPVLVGGGIVGLLVILAVLYLVGGEGILLEAALELID